MARASQTTQKIGLPGLEPVLTAPTADGDIADVGPGVFLLVDNGSSSTVTVTVQTPTMIQDLALADRTVPVAAGTTRLVPLTMPEYKQPAASPGAGRAYVDYSSVTSVTRGVLSL